MAIARCGGDATVTGAPQLVMEAAVAGDEGSEHPASNPTAAVSEMKTVFMCGKLL
ncbi:hypothetical protein ACQPZJ_14000 [Actinoplanes sp. CA-054009]